MKSPLSAQQKRDEVKRLLADGLTYRQVQAELGLSSTSLVAHYAKGSPFHVHRLRATDRVGVYSCKCGDEFARVETAS